ncbi:MAG TPA: tetratricopeptide repeat protein [Isosphaeraceae bacterium]|jgi:Flp pilus assembly protein TadD|nr:tetratricopeptide repeat protein [Isosphaeraceae bacterium]
MPRRRITRRRLDRWLRGKLDTTGLLGLSADDRAELAWQAHQRFEAGELDQAARIFGLLAHLAPPNDVTGALGLAVCLQAQGSLDEAERGYESVLAADPENLFALTNRAEVRLLIGRLEEARADLAAASAILDRGGPADLRPRIERLKAHAEMVAAASNPGR